MGQELVQLDGQGRVTIPKGLREELGLQFGDWLQVEKGKGSVMLRKLEVRP